MQKPEKEKAPRTEAFDFKEEYQKLGKNYPVLADALPEDHKLPLIIYFNKQDPARLQEANKSVGKASEFVWRSLNKILDLGLKDDEIRDLGYSYIFFYPKEATGRPGPYVFTAIPMFSTRKNADPDARQKLRIIAGNYKIHLMPHRKFTTAMVIKLLKAIQQDPALGKSIYAFKVRYKSATEHTLQVKGLPQRERLPRIVIYPNETKEDAQKVLDKITALFKDDVPKGIGYTPRWNQKVNDLIYFAQGDGDAKKNPAYARYFEQPAMIYYEPNFSGNHTNYHLRF